MPLTWHIRHVVGFTIFCVSCGKDHARPYGRPVVACATPVGVR